MTGPRSRLHPWWLVVLMAATGVAAGLTIWFLTLWAMWIFAGLMLLTSYLLIRRRPGSG